MSVFPGIDQEFCNGSGNHGENDQECEMQNKSHC